MPHSLRMKLSGDEEHIRGTELSSLFHGVLMERIDSSYAAYLHESQLHPYSQSIIHDHKDLVWQVNSLDEESEKKILLPLLDASFHEIEIKHKGIVFQIGDKKEYSTSYHELVNEYYFGEKSRYLTIRFLTPTSFKQDGQYCLFPDIRLIFQSLMKKYDQASVESSIFSEELLEHYNKYASIVKYRLQSAIFFLEGVKVPGFKGDITIKINGPQQMINMAWMLAKFGEYSGVGIKTGIGMGAMRIIDSYPRGKGVDNKNG